jgi:uncharacterized Zn finger protein
MVHSNGKNGKSEDKARALVTTGRVRLTYDFNGKPDGATVTNAEGFAYRVDFDLGGRPHCQCKGFEFTGWCKHLTAAYMVAGQDNKPEDEEPTDEELAAYAQQDEEEERLRQLILDAGLDGCYGIEGAAYALAW